jgi:site-specific recombinase XerD
LESREAKIVGKGNKQRVAFFTRRAVFWLQQYLATRQDQHPALFVCQSGRSRLKRDDIWRPFDRYRRLAGINKPVTPHLLRHTAATQLLFNGCPIGHIKEILGHERLETTCRYYLGLDRRAAKEAHERYLTYTPYEAALPSGIHELQSSHPEPDGCQTAATRNVGRDSPRPCIGGSPCLPG